MGSRRDWYRKKHPTSSKIKSVAVAILMVVLVVVMIGGGYFLYKEFNKPVSKPINLISESRYPSVVDVEDTQNSVTDESNDVKLSIEEEQTATSLEEQTATSLEEQTVSEISEETTIPTIPDRDYAVVVLDAGHGGRDGGCEGTCDAGSVLEKSINLSMVLLVKEKLEAKGNIEVHTIRDTDVFIDKAERPVMTNDIMPDLFVSFHCNSYDKDKSVNGLECYFHPNRSSDSGAAAEKLIAALKQNKTVTSKIRGTRTADHVVTREAYSPAILIEMGFLTNTEECNKLASSEYQNTLAQAFADAIYSIVKK